MTTTPTVYDVAERSGVSIATVSRVYRNPDSVRAQTREKVLAAARELGYVPSGNARGLASRSTGVLGLCFPDYSDPDAESEAEAGVGDEPDDNAAMLYSDQIIRGMERAARRRRLRAADRGVAEERPRDPGREGGGACRRFRGARPHRPDGGAGGHIAPASPS